MHDDFIKFAGKMGQSRRSSETELGMALKELVPGMQPRDRLVAGKRVAVWEFPTLEECRAAFDKATNFRHPWPEESTAMWLDEGRMKK